MKIFRRKISQIPAHITRTRKKRRPERQTRSSSTIRFNSGLCPKGTTRDDSTLSSPTRRWSARSWWRKSGSSPKYRPSSTSPNQGSSRRRQALSRIPSAHSFVSWMAINIRPPPPFRWLQSRSPQHIARQEFVRRYYKSTPVQSGVALLIVLVKIASLLFRNVNYIITVCKYKLFYHRSRFARARRTDVGRPRARPLAPLALPPSHGVGVTHTHTAGSKRAALRETNSRAFTRMGADDARPGRNAPLILPISLSVDLIYHTHTHTHIKSHHTICPPIHLAAPSPDPLQSPLRRSHPSVHLWLIQPHAPSCARKFRVTICVH